MNYLALKVDGLFSADAKSRTFTTDLQNAWRFSESGEAYHAAKMLRHKNPDARAVSEKAYLEEMALDAEDEIEANEMGYLDNRG